MVPKDKPIDLTPEVNKCRFSSLRSAPRSRKNLRQPLPLPPQRTTCQHGSHFRSQRAEEFRAFRPLSSKQLVLPSSPMDRHMAGMDSKLLDKLNHQQDAGNGANKRVQGFSNLDDLLDRGGKLNASTAPILMPTDLLFEYGSDELQEEGARLSLMKLGLPHHAQSEQPLRRSRTHRHFRHR